MFDKLNNTQIEELLHEQLVGHLGCHADSRTYVVPVSYAYDGNYIYVRTHEGMKIRMMRKNPSVCFQVDDKKNLAKWRSVVIWGKFEELKEKSERDRALQVLASRRLPSLSSETMHLGAEWPFGNKDLSTVKGVIFRISVQEKSGCYEEPEEVVNFVL